MCGAGGVLLWGLPTNYTSAPRYKYKGKRRAIMKTGSKLSEGKEYSRFL